MKPVDKIIIVGGGTSGWCAAALFSLDFDVILIDKEKGERVGVGEATLLNFSSFMNRCGFPSHSWMNEIDATFKGGILFKNWKTMNEDIWHPFLDSEFGKSKTSLINLWSKCQDLDFKKYACGLYELSMNRYIHPEYQNNSYAFHIDCNLLVKFIQNQLTNRITHIQSDVKKVIRNEDGSVQRLVLANEINISGDLYLDCTGFKRLLSSNSDIISLRDRLFCDTAIACHVEYENEEIEFNPYVTCEAVDHGWIWQIPTQSRLGTGLVFNRSITDPEDAKKYFIDYWNSRISYDQLKVLDWSPFYTKNAWNHNVVSIGLSNGFIEPLESTGLALIFYGIEQLHEQIMAGKYHITDLSIYNALMENTFETCVDFINMHYFDNQREGKFWDFVRDTHIMNDSHQYYMNQMSSPITKSKDRGIFSGFNWYTWMIQLGHSIVPKNNGVSVEESKVYLEEFYKKTNSI
jgi:tryptophan halogenase